MVDSLNLLLRSWIHDAYGSVKFCHMEAEESICKSYNRKNRTWYVYDTQYIWSEEAQKKVRVSALGSSLKMDLLSRRRRKK